MAKEIELKFLVESDWEQQAKDSGHIFVSEKVIRQGYITTGENSVRVRITGTGNYASATLTIKGKATGISRDEYEYTIPVKHAEEMLETLCGKRIIEKTRQFVIDEYNQQWEVDTFTNKHKGMVLAELELDSEEQTVHVPRWVKQDVSTNPHYTNAFLSENTIMYIRGQETVVKIL